jgi:hypothetical protein
MDAKSYCNSLLYRLESVFFHELSGCAHWKTEMVGVDFIQAAGVKGSNEDGVVRSCIDAIVKGGLVEEMSYSLGGKGVLLRMKVKGCQHIEKEALLRKDGIKPYNCPIANMVMDQLIEKLNYTTTYLADMIVNEATGQCDLKAAIYATVDKIGEVSDWSREQGAP